MIVEEKEILRLRAKWWGSHKNQLVKPRKGLMLLIDMLMLQINKPEKNWLNPEKRIVQVLLII